MYAIYTELKTAIRITYYPISLSGIKLCFKTDSRKLGMSIGISPASSRKYFAVDILVDGEYIGGLNNFEGTELPQKYTVVDLKIEDAEKTFDLGNGEKLVEIYLPWSANAVIKEMSLDDGAYIKPVKREKKLLAFGDSITHMSYFSDPLTTMLYNRFPGKCSSHLNLS